MDFILPKGSHRASSTIRRLYLRGWLQLLRLRFKALGQCSQRYLPKGTHSWKSLAAINHYCPFCIWVWMGFQVSTYFWVTQDASGLASFGCSWEQRQSQHRDEFVPEWRGLSSAAEPVRQEIQWRSPSWFPMVYSCIFKSQINVMPTSRDPGGWVFYKNFYLLSTNAAAATLVCLCLPCWNCQFFILTIWFMYYPFHCCFQPLLAFEYIVLAIRLSR